MSISKNLSGVFAIRQKSRTKNTFGDTVYNILVVKKFCKNIKRFV